MKLKLNKWILYIKYTLKDSKRVFICLLQKALNNENMSWVSELNTDLKSYVSYIFISIFENVRIWNGSWKIKKNIIVLYKNIKEISEFLTYLIDIILKFNKVTFS